MNETETIRTFSESGINEQNIAALSAIGIFSPTAVQARVIPHILADENTIFQSETGTGKTFAYLLPLLQKIDEDNKSLQAIILSPTYELASQINAQIKKVSALKSILCIGGTPIRRQIEALKEKPYIIVGNVARILELIHLKKIKTNNLRFIVLDEVDRVIAHETFDFTKEFFSLTNNEDIQLIACSATVKEKTVKTVETLFKKSLHFEKLPQEDILKNHIEHWALFAERREKIDVLRSLINAENTAGNLKKMVIFTAKLDQVENIAQRLSYKKINCVALHAKMGKMERKNAIDSFRSGKAKILVTSDLTARGLDIEDITHVVQMDISDDETFFIHRAGRTSRQGKKGINIVIGDEREMQIYSALEKKLHITVYPKMLYKGKVEKCS